MKSRAKAFVRAWLLPVRTTSQMVSVSDLATSSRARVGMCRKRVAFVLNNMGRGGVHA